MSIEKKTASTLNDLIEVARDGDSFYRDAAAKVKDSELSSLFTKIAATKAEIVAQLSHVVSAIGEKPSEHGTIVGSMQEFYGKIRATFGDTEYGYVAELEESEDRLLKEFKNAANDHDISAAGREEALALLPKVQETHAVMRDRKHAMKPKS
jgi:uncharacterized protein (TIGR02284 family)